MPAYLNYIYTRGLRGDIKIFLKSFQSSYGESTGQ